MAITALTLSATKNYVSDLDPAKKDNPEHATNFVLGAIDTFVNSHVFDRALEFKQGESNNVQSAGIKMNEMDVETVRFGLKDIKNLKDGDGNDIPFTTQVRVILGKTYNVVSEEILRILPLGVQRELAREIRNINTLTKAEAKN